MSQMPFLYIIERAAIPMQRDIALYYESKFNCQVREVFCSMEEINVSKGVICVRTYRALKVLSTTVAKYSKYYMVCVTACLKSKSLVCIEP